MTWLRQIADRPIGERERRGAFLAAASVLIVAAVALVAVPAGHQVGDVPGSTPTVSRTTGLDRSQTPGTAAVESAARRFVKGYLRFAYGQGDSRSIDSAAPSVVAKLIESHERVTPAAKTRDARIEDLDIRDVVSGRAAATATVEVDGVSFPITMKLGVRGNRWLVESVGAD